MQNMVLSLIINFMMAGLLLATIIYCLKLNNRIRILQDSKSDLARIIREFDESTQRATQSIAEIHQATARLSDNIQHKIDKANFLMTDLDYLIDRGAKITGKTEMVSPRPSSVTPLRPDSAPPARPNAGANAAPRAVMEDVPAAEAAARKPLRMRSRAEQELLSALGGTKPTDRT
ncbi:MAG: DUF6468 domain-containing protein [Rickettsiales bacterium]